MVTRLTMAIAMLRATKTALPKPTGTLVGTWDVMRGTLSGTSPMATLTPMIEIPGKGMIFLGYLMFGLECILIRIGMTTSLRMCNMYIHRTTKDTLIRLKCMVHHRRMLDMDSQPVGVITLSHRRLQGSKPADKRVR